VRVDGVAYSILRVSFDRLVIPAPQNISEANVTNRVVMPTQITLTAQVGPMQVNVTFFNPVEVCSKFFSPLNLDSLILFSQGIGSGSQYPSHTSPSRQSRLIVQLIKWKCILTSAHVCEIVSQNCCGSPESLSSATPMLCSGMSHQTVGPSTTLQHTCNQSCLASICLRRDGVRSTMLRRL